MSLHQLPKVWTSGAALHTLRWLLCGPGGHEAWSFGFFSARVSLPVCLQSLGSISMAARFGGAPASLARCSRAVAPAGVGASVQLGGVQQGGCPSWCGVPVRGCVWGTAPCGFGIGLLIHQALKYAVTHCIPPTDGLVDSLWCTSRAAGGWPGPDKNAKPGPRTWRLPLVLWQALSLRLAC